MPSRAAARKPRQKQQATVEKNQAAAPSPPTTFLGRHVEEFIDEFLAARAISLDWVQRLSREDFEAVLLGVKDALTAQAGHLTTDQLQPLTHEIERQLTQWFQSKPSSTPAPSRASEPAQQETHEPPQMAPHQETITVTKDGTLLKGGVRYQSLYAAAPLAKTSPTTLRDWIKKPAFLNGPPLQSYYFAPSDTHFISEQSIERAANRFIKYPSGEPAGNIILGETDDYSGYIGLPAARDILGISNRTMHLWATERKAPDQQQPDIIKDPISGHLYICEAEVYRLKKLVPKRGLPLGRRPHLHPSAT